MTETYEKFQRLFFINEKIIRQVYVHVHLPRQFLGMH